MFLRPGLRKNDGKTHIHWNIVEAKRLNDGRVVQRQVLYLGGINASRQAAWRKAIEVFDEDTGAPRTLSLSAEDPCAAALADASIVRLRLSELRLCRPRQWSACWLAGQSWTQLQLGSVPVRLPAAEPQRHAVGSGSSGACDPSADCSGQRMATSSRMV